MSRAKLYFVRHGETDWNAEARLQGARNIPLNEKGRLQAQQAGKLIERHAPAFETLDYVSSPLIRTRQTMTLLRGTLRMPEEEGVLFDGRLQEIAFGDWEGLTWPEIRERDAERVRARDTDRWGYVPPGGESYAMAAERVSGFLEGIERDTVIVAHGGIARVMLALLSGMPEQSVVQLPIWQGKILVFEEGRHRWIG